MSVFNMSLVAFATVLFALSSGGQEVDSKPAVNTPDESQIRSTYVLGPDDQIVIRALEAEEISEKPIRIDSTGSIRLPLIGQVHAAGLSLDQLETLVKARLGKYFKDPQVGISLTEYHSQPVSV